MTSDFEIVREALWKKDESNAALTRIEARQQELEKALRDVAADLVELASVFGAQGKDITAETEHLEAADRALSSGEEASP